MKSIRFTIHAQDKLRLMQRQRFDVNEAKVISAVETPEQVMPGYEGRFIAQINLNGEHVLRVVYEETEEITVVTLYPGMRERYEG